MKLTSKTDYCFRVLIYLQKNKERVKIQQIADEYHISKNHLSVVVNMLSELGYIISTLGPHGGIEFNAKYANHTIGELVSHVEELDLVECFDSSINTCNLNPHCKLKGILKRANNAFLQELKNYKISDLV
ncbi:MAG: Rrf2 family transcriptional regulator [Bdellovibrionales bacterium]|nr:Rrf2 family transcriptional regulator [Bdellovibrionales bacterium]